MEDNGRLSQGFGDESSSSSTVAEVKEKLGEAAQQATEQARSAAERGKQKLAEGAEGVTAALRHASEGLRSDEQTELARYTGAIADKVEQFTGMLKNRDLASMINDATRFAQRQPALFLGGAFTTGLIAARFLKSSSSGSSGGSSGSGAAARASQSAFDRSGGRQPSGDVAMGDLGSDSSLSDEATAPRGFGPAPGGYGPASAPGGAHGGSGTFGAEGAGGGPGNDPAVVEGQKGAAE